MKITCLVENTTAGQCAPSHGLSLYIETESHRLLMDTGPSDLLIKNAELLGADLRIVDTVILSHGHYDHGGGILPFAGLNPDAKIYIRRNADGDFYSGDRPIGIDPVIFDLPGVILTDGSLEIDGELYLFGDVKGKDHQPEANRRLFVKTGGQLVRDDFSHEQSLVIREKGKSVLLSGCAHNGILNILERYREIFGDYPAAVISGFHMKKDGEYTAGERETVTATARRLMELPCKYYTCHCTGLPAYAAMKEIMGDRLEYLRCGDRIDL